MADPKKLQQTPQQQQAMCVPLPLFGQIGDKLRELPHRDVDPLLQQLASCQVADITPKE